jgi:6-phosphogluconolactonase (cycloisomerase 2 family)
VDTSTGTPAFIGSTTPIPGAARGAVIDPSGKFLYVSDAFNNNIVGYEIDPLTGILSAISAGPFLTGPAPWSMAFDPSGKFVYTACNGGGIYGYEFDAMTGVLTQIPGSPSAAGNAPMWIAGGKVQ